MSSPRPTSGIRPWRSWPTSRTGRERATACHGLVRFDGGLPGAVSCARDRRRVRAGPQGQRRQHLALKIYVYAALQSDVPFANGAPNLSTDLPCMQGSPPAQGPDRCGPRRVDPHEDAARPGPQGPHARSTRLVWADILGNRDGEVRRSRELPSRKSQEVRTHKILEPEVYPELYGNIDHVVRINYYRPAATTRKAGTPSTSSAGGIPHADQDRLPMPRLDPGGTDRARPRCSWTSPTEPVNRVCRSG